MAAREAQALDKFIREVKGNKQNVLIDIHGWLQQTISNISWLCQAFYEPFRSNSQDGSNGGSGYLTRYASTLGYESLLLELPAGIKSMSEYRKSGINDSMVSSVKNILLHGTPAGAHQYVEDYIAPTCTRKGFKGSTCSKCGLNQGTYIPATGHTLDSENTVAVAPTASKPGVIKYLCTVCGKVGDTVSIKAQFQDTNANAFYSDALDYCYEKGIVKGTSEHMFSPDGKCSRGQIVTFLWRAMGCPAYTGEVCPFVDVAPDAYYADAVYWAYESGITSGITDSTFSPGSLCTRAQIVTFLWRVAGLPNAEQRTCVFTDASEKEYYYEAVLWAIENGITNGYTKTKFAPDLVCKRSESVCFLYRYLTQRD